MQQPDPDLIQALIDSRPQIPPQLVATFPADRHQAIALMPHHTKLQVAQLIAQRMAKALNLDIHTSADDDTLTITITP